MTLYRENSYPYIGALYGDPDTAVRDREIFEKWQDGAEPRALAKEFGVHGLTIQKVLRHVNFEMWCRGICSTEYAIKHNCWLPEWGEKPVIGRHTRVNRKLIEEYHSKYQHDTWLDSRMPKKRGH